jgi:hypothetical protein
MSTLPSSNDLNSTEGGPTEKRNETSCRDQPKSLIAEVDASEVLSFSKATKVRELSVSCFFEYQSDNTQALCHPTEPPSAITPCFVGGIKKRLSCFVVKSQVPAELDGSEVEELTSPSAPLLQRKTHSS